MKDLFEIAAGTMVGRDHIMAGRNNQDALHFLSSEKTTLAVVCDGCGSSKHSEVGAKIGARLIVETLTRLLANLPDEKVSILNQSDMALLLERTRQDVLAQLRVLANQMGGLSFSQTISDYFLFTVMGMLLMPSGMFVFSLGDGIYIVNGEINQIGPFENNEPPYLAYGVVGSSLGESSPELIKFQVHQHLPLEKFKSGLLGTDGVTDLIGAEKKNMPGKEEIVGPISQFWQEDRYFKNPDMIRRRLSILNRESIKPSWEERHLIREVGLLPDDTTMVVIRGKGQ